MGPFTLNLILVKGYFEILVVAALEQENILAWGKKYL